MEWTLTYLFITRGSGEESGRSANLVVAKIVANFLTFNCAGAGCINHLISDHLLSPLSRQIFMIISMKIDLVASAHAVYVEIIIEFSSHVDEHCR